MTANDDTKVRSLIYTAVNRAYGPVRATAPEFDPELCHRCQWIRPPAGQTECTSCTKET